VLAAWVVLPNTLLATACVLLLLLLLLQGVRRPSLTCRQVLVPGMLGV
jgi:hypothetical protein